MPPAENEALASATFEPVDGMSRNDGLFIVQTRSSLHVFDLDARAYLRIPGALSNGFPHDASVLHLTSIERAPAIGDSFFIWVDDPREFAVWDYWRQSSPVAAMWRMTGPTTLPASGTASAGDEDASAAGAGATGVTSGNGGPAPSTPGDRAAFQAWPRPAAGPLLSGEVDVLPGLRIRTDRIWIVTTAPLPDENAATEQVTGTPELEWTLSHDDSWATVLALYRFESTTTRARLGVRSRATSQMWSTTAILSLRLQVADTPRTGEPYPPFGRST